ncbi:glycine cleavage system protein GcvH [Sulfurihydrogenibium azorense]|jgi:glycine cleavage system H protein|uniref:Glycine cleavage system H protein n=1 Tax=Sulfurihydrogenibium azorense (strain DSM 15241 / OCM 825 / Az-Fu1) TaxID=204536 RepID=C1DTS4_SULAA|nr:glycine cleavage system protein GcvH [Sulfurihydrogenibium azorense]ACN99156.1 glycine cleavage system H protein [Sulfurihydrogenibium azorense Az-Fu1]MDM7273073.1 glycine cleavage system protein GcvH [Sulfurihydrogenibium azorense]
MEEYRIPEGLYYTKEHIWVRIENDVATIGITDYGQHQLGDVVFVDLPELGREVESGEVIASVESVKAVSEIYSPVTGKIIAINEDLANDPSVINSDPYGDGWIADIQMKDLSEVEDLMTAEDYKAYLEELEKEEEF